MKRLLLQNKGQSVILGYVLLIVLGLGLAAGVYAFLRSYVPREPPRCAEGVSLIVQQVTCNATDDTFSITLANKGLFSVDGSYIKVGATGRVYKEILNCPEGSEQSLDQCQLYFNVGAPTFNLEPLAPGANWGRTFNYTSEPGMYELQLEPIIIQDNNERILCTEAVITREITCS